MPYNIAYYISSHGFGHAARQQAVIKELARAGVCVHVRTAVHPKFFKAAASYHEQRYDTGMIQNDALHFEVEASLQAAAAFMQEQDALIAAEKRFLEAASIDLVVSDMPPLAVEIAAAGGIPSVVITHFTWDWVYAHYIDDLPQYAFIVERIRESYAKTTLALQIQIPVAHEFDMFPRVEALPLVYNRVTQGRAAVRDLLDIPEGQQMAILSMGGHEWATIEIEALKALEGWVFLVMPGAWEQVKDMPQRFRRIPPTYDDYHNLLAAADVVIGKAGGSTVAEVIGFQTPMIYTLQNHWREAALLHETMQRYASSLYVPVDDFMQGSWIAELEAFAAQPHQWAAIRKDGAQVAAARLLEILTSA